MADQDRRTTTSTTPVPPGTHTTVESTRRRGLPSAVWLVLGAILVVIVLVYLFSGGPDVAEGVGEGDTTNLTVEGDAPAEADEAVEGAAETEVAPEGTDAEVVAPAEEPTEAPAN